jgi:hypothetical protein
MITKLPLSVTTVRPMTAVSPPKEPRQKTLTRDEDGSDGGTFLVGGWHAPEQRRRSQKLEEPAPCQGDGNSLGLAGATQQKGFAGGIAHRVKRARTLLPFEKLLVRRNGVSASLADVDQDQALLLAIRQWP